MRVAFAPHAYVPSVGGAESFAEGLARSLAARGHDVHVVVANIASPEAFYEVGHSAAGVRHETLSGVEVHRIGYVTLSYRLLGKAKGLERMAISQARRSFEMGLHQAISDLNPDCVVTLPHLFPNVENVIAQGVDGRWKVIYAPMLHEQDPFWSIERVSTAVSRVSGVIALTEHERNRLLEAYGARPSSTAVIPPAVQIPTNPNTPGNLRKREILFIGRRTKSKRLDLLVDAMKLVWETNPDVALVIAGPPPLSGSDPAAELDGHPRVRLVDSPDDFEKRGLLQSCYALVNPSTTESFGITTLESWSHATPVVLADSPVSRSVVRDGIDGVLSRPDAVSLALGITSLLDSPAVARRMGEKGRLRIESEFSWERSAARLEALIENLSANPP